MFLFARRGARVADVSFRRPGHSGATEENEATSNGANWRRCDPARRVRRFQSKICAPECNREIVKSRKARHRRAPHTQGVSIRPDDAADARDAHRSTA